MDSPDGFSPPPVLVMRGKRARVDAEPKTLMLGHSLQAGQTGSCIWSGHREMLEGYKGTAPGPWQDGGVEGTESMTLPTQPLPMGGCFCGCGEDTEPGRHFKPGHDRIAEARIITDVYGGTAAFVVAHGYDPISRGAVFWVYENRVHKYSKVHRASCPFCNNGLGLFGGGRRLSGEWHGPFATSGSAYRNAASALGQHVQPCLHCRPWS